MTLSGHDDAWRAWNAALGSERMHHAWLLAGPKGLGKGLFARQAAAALVAQGSDAPQPPPDRHPDILVPEHPPENKTETEKREAGGDYKRKRAIPIDEIRALIHRLTTRPTLGPHRAVIIDPADDLERAAANALLKALEEPPVGTFFLLVAHRPGRLLPTIRSRCRVLRFPSLPDEEVARILADQAPQADAATRAAAVAASEGSPGAALGFVEQGLGEVHTLMTRLVTDGDPQLALRAALSSAIGAKPDRERLAATFDLARATLAAGLADLSRTAQARRIEAHAGMVRLAALAPTHNFDPGLLALEIGGLLASAALPRERA